MFKKLTSIILVLIVAISMIGCYTNVHTVGQGAQGSEEITEGKWYVLFGLVPISDIDTKEMADGATDYTIVTEHTFVDQIISAFTGIVTITKMSVTVKK